MGKYPPNPIGIYDMSGNIWEWCEDVWDDEAYSKHSRNNPIYRGDSSIRVVRGGSWLNVPKDVRCSIRGHNVAVWGYDLGFRLLCK